MGVTWLARTAMAAALLAIGVNGMPASATGVVVRSHSALLSIKAPTQSYNWAGYNEGIVEKNVPGGFHSISGDWIVPTATPHTQGESEYSATWLGIGGGCEDTACNSQDQTLIQTGTEQDVVYDALAGTTTPTYSAWYELIPNSSTTVSLPVAPGDHMHASIVESPAGSSKWVITLQNLTRNQTFSLTTNYSSTYGSAEWILEAPTVVGLYPLPPTLGFAPVPQLTPVQFDNATVNGAAAGLTVAEQWQLTDALGNPEATPSNPDTTLDGFDVCTYSGNACAVPSAGLTTTTSAPRPDKHKT